MPYRQTIRKRKRYVDSLTLGEVAVFTGMNGKTLARKCKDLPYGAIAENGRYVFTVMDACQIFEVLKKRLPKASEVAVLLQEMGMSDAMQIRAEILKLWSRRVCANKDMFDQDL